MLCRLCLYECDLETANELFLNTGEESIQFKLIAKYVSIEVTQYDTLSTIICQGCNKQLEDFDGFLRNIEKRQSELRKEFMEVKCLLSDGSKVTAADLAKNPNFENDEESLLDIKDVIGENEAPIDKLVNQEEFIDNSTNNINLDEDNDFNFSIENDDDDEDDELTLNELRIKSELNKKSKKVKPVKKNIIKKAIGKHKRKKTGNCKTKKSAEKNTKNKIVLTEIPENAVENKDEPLKNRININIKEENKERDDLINKYMKMKCELCNESVETFKDLKTHFRETHNTRAYVICCSLRFYKRFRLIDHIRVHLDPNYFKCQYCAKVLSSRVCMEVHYANKHAEKSNLKYGCSMCERRFAQISNLQAHLLSHSEERKFICEICEKAFKTEYMLKMHKQKMHEKRQLYICDTCGKEYKFKPSFERHVAEHETGVTAPTDECPICGKLLMPNGLRRHLDRHNMEDIECKICGKIVKSKAALKGHIEYAHKKTRCYACTFCDKTFKRPCVLKEHIAMHTGQKLYNCPNCPREFRSKANMYAHNKKIHRAEWEQAQAQLIKQQKAVIDQENEESKTEEQNAIMSLIQ